MPGSGFAGIDASAVLVVCAEYDSFRKGAEADRFWILAVGGVSAGFLPVEVVSSRLFAVRNWYRQNAAIVNTPRIVKGMRIRSAEFFWGAFFSGISTAKGSATVLVFSTEVSCLLTYSLFRAAAAGCGLGCTACGRIAIPWFTG